MSELCFGSLGNCFQALDFRFKGFESESFCCLKGFAGVLPGGFEAGFRVTDLKAEKLALGQATVPGGGGWCCRGWDYREEVAWCGCTAGECAFAVTFLLCQRDLSRCGFERARAWEPGCVR